MGGAPKVRQLDICEAIGSVVWAIVHQNVIRLYVYRTVNLDACLANGFSFLRHTSMHEPVIVENA